MRLLHAIHDFLPRHPAGSEIYAFELCRALSARHHVSIVCAEFDPSARHGTVRWRNLDGLTVAEIVNNWQCPSFEDTYRPAIVGRRLAQVLRAVQPDVLHVHSLLNLSFNLPALARARGIRVVATLHDYTLVCPAGGQRVHRADAHVCRTIDTSRCARCVSESTMFEQIAYSRFASMTRAPGTIRRLAAAAAGRLPAATARLRRAASRAAMKVTAEDIAARLEAARRVMDCVDCFVAPSAFIRDEFVRLGIAEAKIRVSDYGIVPLARAARRPPARPLRIGYVGTIVWHKGVHVLVEAVRGLPSDAYELAIFGDPVVSPEYAASLRARAAGLPVRFMGAFARDAVAEAYAQIDVLVVPSLWLENSPLVIHEAFMAGAAVVAARIGGIAGLIDDGVSGILYDPASPDDLRAVLRRLVDDPAEVQRIARSAPRVKQIVEDAARWDSLYDEVARTPVRSPQR